MVTSVDLLLEKLGDPGRYQGLVFLLLTVNFFPLAFNDTVMVLYGTVPDHHCKMPDSWPWHVNSSIPVVVKDGRTQLDNCQMYKDPGNKALGYKPCVYGWDYKVDPPEWSIVAEWNLVCEQKHMVNVLSLLYLAGGLLGCLVFTTLADRLGRKPILLATLMGQTVLGIAAFFNTRFIFFVILRFIQGMLIQGLQCTTFVMIIEIFQIRKRTLAGMACFFVYATSIMFLAVLGYSIQHWRFIQLAISVPNIITIVYIWLIPESLRWLVISNKADQATAVFVKFGRFSSRGATVDDLTKDLESISKQLQDEHQLRYDCRDLVRSPQMRRNTLFHCFCWFSAFLIYSGLQQFMHSMSSNKYVSFFLVGIVELASYVCAFFLFHRFGRRRPMFILFIMGGLLSITSVLVEHLARNQSQGVVKASLTLGMLGKMCVTACMSGMALITVETFPTVIRTMGFGFCSFWKIAGGLTATLVFQLGSHTLRAIPVILMGVAAMVASFVVLMLPETYHKPLPDTVSESEDLTRRKKPPNSDKLAPTNRGEGRVSVKKVGHEPTRNGEQMGHVGRAIKPIIPLEEEEEEEGGDGKAGEETEMDDHEEESPANQGDNDSISSKRSSRTVRFLGIDEVPVLRTEKKSTRSIDFANDRKVRFSNVVHDIEAVMAAILTIKDETPPSAEPPPPPSPPTEPPEKESGNPPVGENESLSPSSVDGTNNARANTIEESTDCRELFEIRTPPSEQPKRKLSPELNGCIRPMAGILKKPSLEESESIDTKIVRSPYPSRKMKADADTSEMPIDVSMALLNSDSISNPVKIDVDCNQNENDGLNDNVQNEGSTEQFCGVDNLPTSSTVDEIADEIV